MIGSRKLQLGPYTYATTYYMERALNVRVPEVLAGKVDRLAKSEGMTQSEFVRAFREYIGKLMRESAKTIAREMRPMLDAEGVTEENVADWYKKQVCKGRKSTRGKTASVLAS